MQWYYLNGEAQEGPFDGDQMAAFYASGSLGDDSFVWREGQANWLPFSQTELRAALKPADSEVRVATPPNPLLSDPAFIEHAVKFRVGARWFYWIAGLSLLNSLIAFFKGGVFFLVGLGISAIISGVGSALDGDRASLGVGIAFALNLLVIGLVAAAGYFSLRGIFWVYLTAAILYALDGFIFLYLGDWFPFFFHVYVEYALVRGLMALSAIKKAA